MSEEKSKITVQMRKGILEYAILSIINRGEAYASDILDILTENQLIVVEGTLYPLLGRLKDERIIAYHWAESTGGPPRKYYHLTESGKELLLIMDQVWKELSGAVNSIVRNK